MNLGLSTIVAVVGSKSCGAESCLISEVEVHQHGDHVACGYLCPASEYMRAAIRRVASICLTSSEAS